MPRNAPAEPELQLPLATFDGALGRRIIETHIWAVRQGLRGATAYDLFDGYCQRLVSSGMPLWRAHAAMETLHPQWEGYGYIWRRDLNAIQPERYDRVRRRCRLAREPALRSRPAGARRRGRSLDAPAFRGGHGTSRVSGLHDFRRRRRDGLFRATLHFRGGRGPLPRKRDRLLLHDRSDSEASPKMTRCFCMRRCRPSRWR